MHAAHDDAGFPFYALFPLASKRFRCRHVRVFIALFSATITAASRNKDAYQAPKQGENAIMGLRLMDVQDP